MFCQVLAYFQVLVLSDVCSTGCPKKVLGESRKKVQLFKKMLLPKNQSNIYIYIYVIENCLVLFQICPIRLCNLPGFNQPCIFVKMRDFLQKACFENLQK